MKVESWKLEAETETKTKQKIQKNDVAIAKGTVVRNVEEMNVYKKARELTNKIYAITRDKLFSRDYGLAEQIRRASVSIMSNIAEGFERGSNAEFTQFLFIAKGSCSEVRAHLTIALDQKYIDMTVHKDLIEICNMINSMLHNLIKYLKKSNLKERNKIKSS